MKSYKSISSLFLLLVCLSFLSPAQNAGEGGETKKTVSNSLKKIIFNTNLIMEELS